MEKKFIAIMGLVLLCLMAFTLAAPTGSFNTPEAGQPVYGTRTYTFDFNIMDENGDAHHTHPPIINIYWSRDTNTRNTLIISDTNLDNSTSISCADANFVNTTNCTYAWAVPDYQTMTNDDYYLDANWCFWVSADVNAYQCRYFSTGAFMVLQPVPSSIATMIALSLFIVAAGLAAFAVMGIFLNRIDLHQFIAMVVVVLITLMIGWTLYGTMVVP
ncbi:MAG: hypothetical protein H7836_10740 [Magnetococcus sp. YQC-3]